MKSEITSTTHPTSAALLALRLDHLWVLIVLAGIGICIALVGTPPNDFWWHLKVGQIIAEQGLPRTALFPWTVPPDTPYIYGAWLGEWLFFQLYRLTGLASIAIVRNLLGLATFVLVALEAWRRCQSWRLAALGVLAAGALALNNLIIRPQIWSWVPFALLVVILGMYVDGRLRPRALLIVAPIMAFWVNAHGAFVLGLVVLALYAAGETLRCLLDQPRALPWARVLPLYLALLGAVLATLINPLGANIFDYVATLLTDPPTQTLFGEWQPPTIHNPIGALFYLSILALLVALAYARRRLSLTDVLLVCTFLWLAWGGQRYVVWYGLLAMPMLAQCLAAPRSPLPPTRPARGSLANTVLAALFVLALLAVQPPLKALLALPDTYTRSFAIVPEAPGIFSAATPVQAAEYLRQNPQSGRIFNELGYGSYIDWALYPDVPVFIDPRSELYSAELIRDYIAISQADNYNSLLIDKYAVDRVILDRTLQGRLAAALAGDSGRWRLEYSDEHTMIYRRVH
jgi:hypothetical protein